MTHDLSSKPDPNYHPGGSVRYNRASQILRVITFNIWFFCCVVVILITQFIGAPLYYLNRRIYYDWMSRTKQSFGVVITTITQWWSPTIIRVTGDRSVRDQIRQAADGSLECHFPERMILIANHQLYSDWLYLWWIAYTARLHGYFYIILKESLKYIPFIGVGMQFYGFIFMARKWEQDKSRMEHRLSKLNAEKEDPMWLLIFPEGTNASSNGRVNSAKYSEKLGIKDLQHQLWPRSTGLRFCIEQLKESVEYLYDCTVHYEGVRRGEFGQDYFTLYSTFFQGRPPKSVNMHWRRFAVKDIPIEDPAEFEVWLRQRWIEKDELLDYYTDNGCFPEDDSVKEESNCEVTGLHQRGVSKGTKATGGDNWKGPIVTEVRISRWTDVAGIFTVVATVALLANVWYKIVLLTKPFF
ncbi:acyltransferase-domain-containing protein [Pyronema omphalodes]|nr:acyltransferase-domain-containing protein [Pyronema omphalodes]